MIMNNKDLIKKFYDEVAAEYAVEFKDEISKKPIDAKLLELFIERVKGVMYEMGCGTGEISRYIAAISSREIVGTDLSFEMIKQAQKLNPEIKFEQADVFNLQYKSNTIGGIVAFYMIVNFQKNEMNSAFTEIFRVLEKGGWFLLSFHSKSEDGSTIKSIDEFLGKQVSLDFYFHTPQVVIHALENSGFEINEVIVRSPYKDVEYPSERTYIFAKKG